MKKGDKLYCSVWNEIKNWIELNCIQQVCSVPTIFTNTDQKWLGQWLTRNGLVSNKTPRLYTLVAYFTLDIEHCSFVRNSAGETTYNVQQDPEGQLWVSQFWPYSCNRNSHEWARAGNYTLSHFSHTQVPKFFGCACRCFICYLVLISGAQVVKWVQNWMCKWLRRHATSE